MRKRQRFNDVLKQIGETRLTKNKRMSSIILVFWYMFIAVMFFLMYQIFS